MRRIVGFLFASIFVLGSELRSQEIESFTAAPVQVIRPFVTVNHALVEHRFVLDEEYGWRFEKTFRATRPGMIRLEARWEGDAEGLALIVNGPGRVDAYARKDGGSPLVIQFEVTENHLHWGEDWSVSVVSSMGGQAESGAGHPARGWLLVQHPTDVDWRVRPIDGEGR